jgi:haloacetate dehalogenase
MPKSVTPEANAEYLRAFRNPATLHAACEDYRAGASIDLEHDEADLARKVECPLRVLWAERGPIGRQIDVLAAWRERASQVSGKPLPGGHFLPEELPDEVLADLRTFLRA